MYVHFYILVKLLLEFSFVQSQRNVNIFGHGI